MDKRTKIDFIIIVLCIILGIIFSLKCEAVFLDFEGRLTNVHETDQIYKTVIDDQYCITLGKSIIKNKELIEKMVNGDKKIYSICYNDLKTRDDTYIRLLEDMRYFKMEKIFEKENIHEKRK